MARSRWRPGRHGEHGGDPLAREDLLERVQVEPRQLLGGLGLVAVVSSLMT